MSEVQGLPPVNFPSLGWQVIDWIEEYLCHGPGDVQGQPAVVDDEFALFLCWAYRVWPQGHERAGKRVVHRAILSRPKGWAKSERAGMIDCAEALGPVRCDGFDSRGEPVGAPVVYPYIRCLATEEDQTGNTYLNVVYMLTHGKAADEYAVDIGRSVETSTRTIIREASGGEIVPCTAGAESKDGGKESKATADETHLYVLPKLRSMYRTVARNTGKRAIADPWMLDTTTMFQVGERSVFEQAWDRYRHLSVDECVTQHGVLLDHKQGAEPVRFNDDRSLAKAMRPGYGAASEWIDFHKQVQIIRGAEDPEAEAYRYFLNRRRQASEAWLDPEEIKDFLGEVEPEPRSMITLGFDGSENDDHTVLFGCTEAGDLFAVGAWTPSLEEGVEWREDVDRAVTWAFENFQVVRFYADPAYWVSELGGWAGRYGARRVTEFWTGGHSEAKMAFATSTCRTALRHGAKVNPVPLMTDEIKRDGKTLVQWHLENARTRKIRVRGEDDRTVELHLLRKERKGSPLKIDSAVSMVLARRARDDALKTGEFVKHVEAEPSYASW